MPITNTAQAKYYEKKKVELLQKMKNKYINENKEKKKEYYNKNKDEILTTIKSRYYLLKAKKNKEKFLELLNEDINDSIKDEINDYINTDKYKTANKKIFDELKDKIRNT
jgi:hypothetical protein